MDVKELESKTVAELKELAKELDITGISSMKKADLVAAIAGASGAPAEAPAEPVSEPVQEEAAAPEEAPVEPGPEPVEGEAPVQEAPAPEEAPVEPSPEPVEGDAPVQEAAAPEAAPVEAAPAQAPKAAPAPPEAPKVKEAVLTRSQARLREKHDLATLKKEKRTLQSQILAAIAAQDYAKMKELRNRKKELRRLLNRV